MARLLHLPAPIFSQSIAMFADFIGVPSLGPMPGHVGINLGHDRRDRLDVGLLLVGLVIIYALYRCLPLLLSIAAPLIKFYLLVYMVLFVFLVLFPNIAASICIRHGELDDPLCGIVYVPHLSAILVGHIPH